VSRKEFFEYIDYLYGSCVHPIFVSTRSNGDETYGAPFLIYKGKWIKLTSQVFFENMAKAVESLLSGTFDLRTLENSQKHATYYSIASFLNDLIPNDPNIFKYTVKVCFSCLMHPIPGLVWGGLYNLFESDRLAFIDLIKNKQPDYISKFGYKYIYDDINLTLEGLSERGHLSDGLPPDEPIYQLGSLFYMCYNNVLDMAKKMNYYYDLLVNLNHENAFTTLITFIKTFNCPFIKDAEKSKMLTIENQINLKTPIQVYATAASILEKEGFGSPKFCWYYDNGCDHLKKNVNQCRHDILLVPPNDSDRPCLANIIASFLGVSL
jgi:hypothetical protein